MNHFISSTKMGGAARLFIAATMALGLLGLGSESAAALTPPGATITVNTTADETSTTDGTCSLREAITSANTDAPSGGTPGECAAGTAGLNTIVFALTGGGPYAIAATADLLGNLTTPMIIDGTTQSGYSDSPLITIDGGGTINTALAFSPGSTGSKLLGLSFIHFIAIAIELEGGGVTVQDNWIGTSDGTTAAANYIGVDVDSSSNLIGGLDAGGDPHGNVISGNASDGIRVVSGTGNIIQSNFVGVSSSGNAALTSVYGIEIGGGAVKTLVGGKLPFSGNVITTASGIGLQVDASALGTTVKRNIFGLGADGITPVGTPTTNILDIGGVGTVIGGKMPLESNIISNAGYGITVGGFPPSTITIAGNFIGVNGTGAAAGNQTGIAFNNSPAKAVISANVISNSTNWGISFQSFIPAALTVSQNCLSGNVLAMQGSHALHVSANWWGSPTGPSGAGLGSGDPVSPPLIFAPWLTKPPASCNGWAPKSFSPKDQTFKIKNTLATKFSWTAVSTADDYHFTLSHNANLSSPIDDNLALGTVLSHSDALDYGAYYWQTTTVTVDGIAWPSPIHAYYVTIQKSPKPGAVVVPGAFGIITFTWNTYAGAASYVWRIYGPADSTCSGIAGGGPVTTTSHIDTGFSTGQYSWTVEPYSDNPPVTSLGVMPCQPFTVP